MAHRRFGNIEVKPTISAAAYAQNDVLFNPVKIPGAVQGLTGASLLKSVTIIDIDDKLIGLTLELVFMKVSKDLGTINDDANNAASTFMVKKDGTASESCVILGHVEIAAGDYADANTLTNVSLITKTGIDLVVDAGGTSDDDNEEGAIFCAAVLTGNGTPDFTAATDLRIRFGFEY
tara:strand:+ start:64 stop:594 length:531 start_codon:yes stop_codon:yes gene_type:complete